MNRRTKLSNLIALAVVSALAGGCAYRISPRTVSVGEVTTQRPPSTIGPKQQERPFRSLTMSFSKTEIQTLRRIDSTVRVEFDDCAGGHLSVDELYVGETSLDRLRVMTKHAFGAFYRPLGDIVVSRTYVPEALFAERPELCARVVGGSMAGARLTGRRFVLKHAGVAMARTAF